MADDVASTEASEDVTLDDGDTSTSVVEELVVDGKTFTPDEIRRMQERDVNLMRDYTEKTEKLARDRDDLVKDKDEVLSAKDLNLRSQKALQNDKDFYMTHERSEWDNYQAEIDQVMGKVTPDDKKTIGDSPVVKDLLGKVDTLTKTVISMQKEKQSEGFDDIKEKTSKLIKTKYPFADEKAVMDDIYIQWGINKRLPSIADVEKRAAASHDLTVRAAVKLGGKEPVDETLPSSEGSSPATVVEGEPTPLKDVQASVDAGEKYFAKLKAQRKR